MIKIKPEIVIRSFSGEFLEFDAASVVPIIVEHRFRHTNSSAIGDLTAGKRGVFDNSPLRNEFMK